MGVDVDVRVHFVSFLITRGSFDLQMRKKQLETHYSKSPTLIQIQFKKFFFGNVHNFWIFGNVRNFWIFGNIQNFSIFGNIQNLVIFGNVRNFWIFGNVQNFGKYTEFLGFWNFS